MKNYNNSKMINDMARIVIKDLQSNLKKKTLATVFGDSCNSWNIGRNLSRSLIDAILKIETK